MIRANKIYPQVVQLFNELGHCLGWLNECELIDARIQIATEQLTGYYIIHNNKQINIFSDGLLSDNPKGLFDLRLRLTTKLADIATSIRLDESQKSVNYGCLTYHADIDMFQDSETGKFFYYNNLLKLGYDKTILKAIKKPAPRTHTVKLDIDLIKGKDVKVVDFDATLVHSPLPNIGKPLWEKFYDKPFPSVDGWWGLEESLDMDVFEFPDIPHVIKSIMEVFDINDTYILLTGRPHKYINKVQKIVENTAMIFDAYMGNNYKSTIEYKLRELQKMVDLGANSIILWDDRDAHFEPFKQFAMDNIQIPITINKIIHDSTDIITFMNQKI